MEERWIVARSGLDHLRLFWNGRNNLEEIPVDDPGHEHLEAIRTQIQAVQAQLEALGQRTSGVLDVPDWRRSNGR
jgi:predicted metal-dependent hydrolase